MSHMIDNRTMHKGERETESIDKTENMGQFTDVRRLWCEEGWWDLEGAPWLSVHVQQQEVVQHGRRYTVITPVVEIHGAIRQYLFPTNTRRKETHHQCILYKRRWANNRTEQTEDSPSLPLNWTEYKCCYIYQGLVGFSAVTAILATM